MHRLLLFISLLAPLWVAGQSYKITDKVSVKLNTEQLFPAPPIITWASMSRTDTVVNSAQFPLRVCVANFSDKTDTLRVFVNRQELPKERTL
jgi:hypothetical protein